MFAVFEDDTAWTYGETAAQAWRFAASLRALGVHRRELVVSWPERTEALAAWFGTNAGCVYTPLNTGYKGRLLESALNLLANELLIAHAELVPRLDGLELQRLRRLVVLGAEDVVAPPGIEVIAWHDFLDESPHDAPRLDEPVERWEDCTVLFTSGTTGASKAVRRPYELYDGMGEVAFDKPGIGGDDRFFVCAPMFHGGADVPIYAMLRAGGSVAIVQGFRTEPSGTRCDAGAAPSRGFTARCRSSSRRRRRRTTTATTRFACACSRRCSRACTTSRSASTSACSPFTG